MKFTDCAGTELKEGDQIIACMGGQFVTGQVIKLSLGLGPNGTPASVPTANLALFVTRPIMPNGQILDVLNQSSVVKVDAPSVLEG